jgi:OmpA-OmpF porin, OOP family
MHPDATGSIRPPGLDPGDRARPPALAAVAPDGPYRLSLRREAGTLMLTGFVPDAAAREELASLARQRFFQERIVDETRLANGAPPHFLTAARFALDQLSQLASGEAVIAGPSLRLEGEALYAQMAEDIEKKMKRKPPAGFKGSAAIRMREIETSESQ